MAPLRNCEVMFSEMRRSGPVRHLPLSGRALVSQHNSWSRRVTSTMERPRTRAPRLEVWLLWDFLRFFSVVLDLTATAADAAAGEHIVHER